MNNYETFLESKRINTVSTGFELKKSYFDQSVKNLMRADYEAEKPKQVGMDYFGSD